MAHVRLAVPALLFALLSTSALAFRDDIPADYREDCTPERTDASPGYREACGLAAIESACAADRTQVADELARGLGVHTLHVLKSLGRRDLSAKEPRHLCDEGLDAHRAAIAGSLVPKRQVSESGKEWILGRLIGADGYIDDAAIGRALEQRRQILGASMTKRAGLPPLATGWTTLTGFNQSSGRVNDLLIHPTTTNTMWAGTDGGGIWKSTNGGTNWSPIDDFLGSLSITNLAMSPSNTTIMYAATNPVGSHTYFPFGVLKSVDSGATWNQLAQTNPTTNADWRYVQRIAVHPTNANHVLAATYVGAYISVDGGGIWSKLGGINTRATFVAIHPTVPNNAAVAYHDGTVRYTTNGDLVGAGAFTSTVLAGGRYLKIAYAKSDATRMYALVSDPTTSATRVYKSTTSGGAWVEITASIPVGQFYNSGYLSYTGNIWVDPLAPDRVSIVEGWAWFTPNINAAAPITFTRLCSGWTDYHAVVAHPNYDGVGNKIVYFTDDGGVYRVNDIDALGPAPCGAGFTRLEVGMNQLQVYSVAGRGGNIIIGNQDVAPRVHRSGIWQFVCRVPACNTGSWIGDGATAAASTSNPSVLYGSRQYLDMFRSTDGGLSGTSIVSGSALNEGGGVTPTSNTNAAFIAPFVLDPSNQSRMLAGGHSLWRSNNVDTGAPPTWTSIRAPYLEPACGAGYTAPVDTIAIAPSNPDVIWIAHACAGSIFKTVNGTVAVPTWTAVTTLPALAVNRSKASIMIDRNDPNVVWVGLGAYQTSTLFKTTDGGATSGGWTTVAGLPGAPVNSLVQHPFKPTWIFAATGVGLFASDNAGATWSTSNEGPANVVVQSLDWYSTGPNAELLVGTFGRGVFRATVGAPSGANRADLNADGKADLLWRNTADGSVQGWLMNGLTATTIAGLLPAGGYTVTHVADLDGDGKADLLIRHTDGTVIGWLMNGLGVTTQSTLVGAGSGWTIMKIADLDGDGKADLIWQHTDGTVQAWLMNGLSVASLATFVGVGSGWSVSQVGDLDGDGKSDLIWQHATGTVQAWLMNGLGVTSVASYVPAGSGWSVVLTGDFNGDGKADLMWQHTGGTTQAWLMNGLTVSQVASFTPAASGWSPVLAGDLDGDGKADLFWQHTGGASQTWLMNGLTVSSLASFVPGGTGWTATHLTDLSGDGKKDVLWRHTTGAVQAWIMNGLTITQIGSLAAAGTYAVIPLAAP